MTNPDRRYDIDWLRVIAIGFLLIYHIGIAFQPWGVFIGFIQNDKPLEGLWAPMSLLNIWRIPLLFFVSGMGLCFAMKKRSWMQVLKERTKRILVPLIFGVIFIVPLHLLLWQKYYRQDITYTLNLSHLWFLANIFIYVLILSPVFFVLKGKLKRNVLPLLESIFSNPFGLLIVCAVFVLEGLLVNPDVYETYSMTLHGFLLGMLAFFFGFIFIYTGNVFWKTVRKWKFLYLGIAMLFFVARWYFFDLKAPNYLLAIESNMWIFAFFGIGYDYLNRPGKILRYLSESAYPIYIIHMIVLYLVSYFIIPLEISATVKFILTIIFTAIACFTIYELLIRRIGFLRPFFGLKVT